MPKLHLTDLAVQRLRPGEQQLTYWDTLLRGFGVRVSRQRKTWTVMRGAQRQRVSVGIYPDVTLSEARKKAKELLSEEPPDHERITFGRALELFLGIHCAKRNKPSTAKATEWYLRRFFLPALGSKALTDIATRDIIAIIDGLLSKPSIANHAFGAVRTFFRWSVRRTYLPHSPCQALQMPARTVPRDRVLSHVELHSVWRAADRCGYPFGTIVQLLIVTGQRRNEIAGLRWEWIDQKSRTITLPDTKNNRPHTFPYGGMAEALLNTIPTRSGFLFPARGENDRHFCGWSKTKENFESLPAIRPWTLHDLRRTFATNLAALGVPPHITERLLNHVSGTISGVAAIYNRYAYSDVSKWETRLASLLAQ